MKKLFIIILLFSLSLNVEAQCSSYKGIMNASCASLDIVTPPALEISVGLGLFDNNLMKNVLKVDVNYITECEIVYGFSMGVIPDKPAGSKLFDNANANIFVGYNVAGCVILGPTLGVTNITTARINNDAQPVIYRGLHANVGMSIKFILSYFPFPVTLGAYGSSGTGIGASLGSVIPLNHSLWHTIKTIF